MFEASCHDIKTGISFAYLKLLHEDNFDSSAESLRYKNQLSID